MPLNTVLSLAWYNVSLQGYRMIETVPSATNRHHSIQQGTYKQTCFSIIIKENENIYNLNISIVSLYWAEEGILLTLHTKSWNITSVSKEDSSVWRFVVVDTQKVYMRYTALKLSFSSTIIWYVYVKLTHFFKIKHNIYSLLKIEIKLT